MRSCLHAVRCHLLCLISSVKSITSPLSLSFLLQTLQHENQRLLAGKLQSSKMLDAAARAKEGLQSELAAARKVSRSVDLLRVPLCKC